MILVDELLAVLAMVTAIPAIQRGLQGSSSQLSWRRTSVLVGGGLASWVSVVGLMALETHFLGRGFFVPTWLGSTLAFFGGMLGTSTLLVPRGQRGMSEPEALRVATQSVAMTFYLAEPVASLLFLGATRLFRAAMPWTIVRTRWLGILEGLVLLALCLAPRDETHGGLRRSSELGAADEPAVVETDG
ncbi:MAG: hypothetical protein ACI9EF_003754 [Pseudohongiellaceae bacterium]|jgi:hypothetical protein